MHTSVRRIAFIIALVAAPGAFAQFPTGHLPDPTRGSPLKAHEKVDPKALPVVLDNRSQFGPIKSQGTCGSCTIFSTTALLEAALVRDGLVFRGSAPLAEQLTLDCASTAMPPVCDNGSFAGPVLGVLNSFGATSAPVQYIGAEHYVGSYNACVAALNTTTSVNYAFRPRGYRKIEAVTVADIKQAISTYGAVVTSLYVTQTFQNYRSTSTEVIAMDRCNVAKGCGWHSIVLAGWDDNKQAFIGRNSWGSNWGRSGYFLIAYSEVNRYSASQLAVSENGVYVIESTETPVNYSRAPDPTVRTLTVSKSGDGAGTVASSLPGIACGADCAENYPVNTTVSLTATASANSTFSGWIGACAAGTAADVCRVSLSDSSIVIADFLAKPTGALEPAIVGVVGANVATQFAATPVVPSVTLAASTTFAAPITRIDNLVLTSGSPATIVIDSLITASGRYDRERNRDRFAVLYLKTMTLDPAWRGQQVIFTHPRVTTSSLNGLNGGVGATGANGSGEVNRNGNPGQPGGQGGKGETGRSVQYPQILVVVEKLKWSTGQDVAPGEVTLRFDFAGLPAGAGGNGGRGGHGGNGAPGKIGASGLFGCLDGAGTGGKGGDGGVGGLPGDGGDGGNGADVVVFTSVAQNALFQTASLSLAGGPGGGGGKGGDSGDPGTGGSAAFANGYCGPGRAGVDGSKPVANLGTGATGFPGLEGSYVAYALKPPAQSAVAQINAPNYQGLWWNPGESGWGVNLAHQGDTLFATWFTYDATGKGWWLIASAVKSGEGIYTGALYETRGPPFGSKPFNPNLVTSNAVGSATFDFLAAGGPTFAYTVNGIAQKKSIVRQAFGPLPVCSFGDAAMQAAGTNYQDIWWTTPPGSESGWGINLTHQGDTIFATWFTYDTDGTPMWLIMSAAKTGPGAYGGTLYRTTGPAFGAAPFDTGKVKLASVGSGALTFADGSGALFAYTVNGVSQSKLITRQVFSSPVTVCK